MKAAATSWSGAVGSRVSLHAAIVPPAARGISTAVPTWLSLGEIGTPDAGGRPWFQLASTSVLRGAWAIQATVMAPWPSVAAVAQPAEGRGPGTRCGFPRRPPRANPRTHTALASA